MRRLCCAIAFSAAVYSPAYADWLQNLMTTPAPALKQAPHNECQSESSIRAAGSYPMYTRRLPGYVGRRCWYAAHNEKPTVHSKRNTRQVVDHPRIETTGTASRVPDSSPQDTDREFLAGRRQLIADFPDMAFDLAIEPPARTTPAQGRALADLLFDEMLQVNRSWFLITVETVLMTTHSQHRQPFW